MRCTDYLQRLGDYRAIRPRLSRLWSRLDWCVWRGFAGLLAGAGAWVDSVVVHAMYKRRGQNYMFLIRGYLHSPR